MINWRERDRESRKRASEGERERVERDRHAERRRVKRDRKRERERQVPEQRQGQGAGRERQGTTGPRPASGRYVDAAISGLSRRPHRNAGNPAPSRDPPTCDPASRRPCDERCCRSGWPFILDERQRWCRQTAIILDGRNNNAVRCTPLLVEAANQLVRRFCRTVAEVT